MALADKHCVPCRGGVPTLTSEEVGKLLPQLKTGWRVVENHHLEKTYVFPDFAQGLEFVNAVAAIAEAEGHHPDVHLAWGKVELSLWTHAIDGLHESDFILAAKIDELR